MHTNHKQQCKHNKKKVTKVTVWTCPLEKNTTMITTTWIVGAFHSLLLLLTPKSYEGELDQDNRNLGYGNILDNRVVTMVMTLLLFHTWFWSVERWGLGSTLAGPTRPVLSNMCPLQSKIGWRKVKTCRFGSAQ